MSPNFGLGNAQKQEKEHEEEEEPPRKLSSQVVPIHRYLCIHAHTLGHWALAKKKGASSLCTGCPYACEGANTSENY